jgi:hypothetical protein
MVPASLQPYRAIARFNGRTDALTGAGPPTRYLFLHDDGTTGSGTGLRLAEWSVLGPEPVRGSRCFGARPSQGTAVRRGRCRDVCDAHAPLRVPTQAGPRAEQNNGCSWNLGSRLRGSTRDLKRPPGPLLLRRAPWLAYKGASPQSVVGDLPDVGRRAAVCGDAVMGGCRKYPCGGRSKARSSPALASRPLGGLMPQPEHG